MAKAHKTALRVYLIGITIPLTTFLISNNFLHQLFRGDAYWDDILFAITITMVAGFWYQSELRKKAIEEHRFRVFKATMCTIHDLVGNFLNCIQQVREDSEELPLAESLEIFDCLTAEVVAHLKALSDLENPMEQRMAIGTGIYYPAPKVVTSKAR